jgi:hypothetical protein
MDEASHNLFVWKNPENHEAISYIQLLADLKRQLHVCMSQWSWDSCSIMLIIDRMGTNNIWDNDAERGSRLRFRTLVTQHIWYMNQIYKWKRAFLESVQKVCSNNDPYSKIMWIWVRPMCNYLTSQFLSYVSSTSAWGHLYALDCVS